jgi:rhamnose transport system permease protein
MSATPVSATSPPQSSTGATPFPLEEHRDLDIAPQQVILALILLFEVAIFGMFGENFLSLQNLLTVSVQNVELGLLALALTPVILTGGIDLSVGSLIGLCAVTFGVLWRDAHLSAFVASILTLLVATVAGMLNAVLITRGGIPPLIVTLGTFSLFRGIAEGVTAGQGSYVDFPAGFLKLGQGSILGIPTQLWIFVPAAVFFYLLVHRSVVGRALSAIGFSADGARHAGLNVKRLTGFAYVLSGFCAGVASLVYVARFGQAKADAALGYELGAITAVVLGGTSIFGGRGSVIGTLLGLFAVAFLENGQALAGQKREVTGILVGVMLLAAIGLDFTRLRNGRTAAQRNASEELDMRNSQLAVLCAVIIAAALIITGGNFMLVKSLKQEATASGGGAGSGRTASGGGSPETSTGKRVVVGMMPKSKGNAYFIACQKGAEEAAKEMNVEMLWDGPTSADPAEQNKIVETWITRKVDVISVAVENAGGLSTALKKARDAGIKVITWDADANKDARDFFCNQATPEGIGDTLLQTASDQMGGKGRFVVISGSQTAANLGMWRDRILSRMKDYPDMTLAEVVYCDDKQNIALDLGKQMLNKYPDLKLIMAICSPGVPGAAEAVKQSGRTDVKVIGLGLPNENKKYVHDGVTQAVILWKTADLGYLAVAAAKAAAEGTLKPGDTNFTAGRLGKMEIQGTDILLGKPFVFTKDNIDQFDF